MLLTDRVLAGVEEALSSAIEEPKPGWPDADALRALREDLAPLGLFGLLTALSEAPAPSEGVHRDQVDQVRRRLLQGLDDGGQEPDLAAAPPLVDVLERYLRDKGDRVTRRAIENALFDFYDLQDHGLFVDDVAKGFDVVRATRGDTDDIKGFIRAATRLSGETAKFVLGLFPEQIQLIHRISERTAEPHEIEAAFDAFGPRAIRLRLFGVCGTLIEKEKRFRLAITLWARGRGVAITREHILGIVKHVEVKTLDKLVMRAVAQADARRALIAFAEAHPVVAAIERCL
jgi:hypothetical protein